MTEKKKKSIFIAAMALMLVLQLLTMLYYGSRKEGFHEDELYTYYSTNKTAGLFVNDREWMTRDQLRNDFVVLPGEQFRYQVVKQMQSWDVHPPLYYYLVHTVCSFFPNVFSKWLGIGINMAGFALSFLLLGYCACTLASDTGEPSEDSFRRGRQMAFLTCLGWGFSSAVISGVMFIRMYQWLTFFILLCAMLHIRAMKKQDYRIWTFYLPLTVTVFGGFLTQYYYIIFHFFMGAGFCIYLLSKKRFRELLLYAGSCAVGLAAAIAYYPSCLSHIFRGYRGTEAVSEFTTAGNTWERVQFFYGLFDDYVMNQTLSWWLLILCLIAVTVRFLHKRNKQAGIKLPEGMILLLFSCAGYFFVVAKTALLLGETSNRYELPIYGLLVLLLLMGTVTVIGKQRFLVPFLGALLLLIDITAMMNGKVFFLYEEEKPVMEYVKENTDAPVIVFYNEASADNIWWLSNELMEYPEVYLASQGNKAQIDDEKIENASKILVYVADYDEKEQCILQLMEENPKLSECRTVAEKGLWTLYEIRG